MKENNIYPDNGERLAVLFYVKTTSKVTNPGNKKLWFASVSIGYDYNQSGETIEKAYVALANRICDSQFILNQLKEYKRFKKIIDLKLHLPKNYE